MIRSMTGFGAATAEVDGARYAVEIRSVNNRFFKATLRLPEALLSLEAELESQVARRLVRGSVVIGVRVVDASARAAGHINAAALKSYMSQLEGVLGRAIREQVPWSALFTLPGVVMDDSGETLCEAARPILRRLADEACDRVLQMRQKEGEGLRAQLVNFGEDIRRGLAAIRERAPLVGEQYAIRLRARMTTMLAEAGAAVREEDILREVAAFAERADIAEEVARLAGHVEQFETIIGAGNPEPAGRTLDFLAQEMLREANTIASKSSDVEISRRVVEVKTAIDRIKEQAQNAE